PGAASKFCRTSSTNRNRRPRRAQPARSNSGSGTNPNRRRDQGGTDMLELNRSNTVRSLGLALLVAAAGCAHGGSKAVPSNGMAAASSAARPSGSAADHVTSGNDLLKQGKLDEAEHEFRLALDQDPNDVGGLAGLGQVEVARGRFSDALPHLEKATRASSQM